MVVCKVSLCIRGVILHQTMTRMLSLFRVVHGELKGNALCMH